VIDQGLLEMNRPEKSTSSQQKYRLIKNGAARLANWAIKGPKGP
jgi:hypothetical protein